MGRKLTIPAGVTGVVALAVSAAVSVTGAAASAHTAGAATASAGTASAAAISTAIAAAPTTTPIKHVIVIIGENHSFDNVFATYQPPKGQHVQNLLSEGIVTKNGTPGPNVSKAKQLTASDTKTYSVAPKITGAYKVLPQPNTTYVAPGCDGQAANSPDDRFPANLPNAPYQITKYVPYFDDHLQYTGGCEFYGAYVGDPLHRFYQMTQQTLGYQAMLNTWVANTAGDDNGAIPPAPIFQGAVQMGYYNMAQGDAPILQDLAQHYAISDNYHQAVQGGTGANHIALGTGYAASYQNASGLAHASPAGRDREPEPQAGHEQQLHPGRLRQRHRAGRRRQLLRMRRPGATRGRPHRPLPGGPALPDAQELQARPVLPAQQLQRGLQHRRHGEHGALHRPAAEVRLRDDRRLALGARPQLGLLRRGLQQRHGVAGVLRHLRPHAVLGLDHDQPKPAQERAARAGRLHQPGHERHAALGQLPQARRRRRPPRLLDARRVRELHGPGDRRGAEQPGGVEVHGDFRHLRRERRLLRLRVYPAAQLLRRRAEGADDRGLPLRPARRGRPHLR